MSNAPSPPTPRQRRSRPAKGVPMWVPLVALIIAVLFAALVLLRIGGTLSALVARPQPVLPPGAVLQSTGSDSVGDWWIYQTDMPACQVAKFYKDTLGTCVFNPASGCQSDGSTGPQFDVPGGQQIAECSGRQVIGAYSAMWRSYISIVFDPKTPDQSPTLFRIYRDG